jgi:hypothetical protein
MSLLVALFLVVHGGVHVGFLCSRSWPFEAGDSWLASTLGVDPAAIAGMGAALVLAAFVGFVLAGLTAIGLLPARLWRPLVAVAAAASAVHLALFLTVATVPGLAIDAVLLWAVVGRGWRPARLVGGRARAGRPVTA